MCIHTHTSEHYSAFKREILPIATIWIYLDIMLSKIDQAWEDRYYRIWIQNLNSSTEKVRGKWRLPGAEMWVKGYSVSVFQDEWVLEVYGIMTTAVNMVSCTRNLLKVNLTGSHHENGKSLGRQKCYWTLCVVAVSQLLCISAHDALCNI